jgi:hypothetical protein
MDFYIRFITLMVEYVLKRINNTMCRTPLALLAAAALLGAGLNPALAKGPGTYTVHGTNSLDGSKYEGTTTITKTGEDTWKIKQDVDGNKYEGYGVGNEDSIAMTFTSGTYTGVALYVAQPDGSYKGIWSFTDDSKHSTETLTPVK